MSIMYDTINMYYQFNNNPIPSIKGLFKNCTNVSHTERENSKYMQGDLKNMRITLNEGSISVKGSLCKYYYGNNCETLNQSSTKEALENISSDLSLDLNKAMVSRIDFSTNIITKYKPTIYYPYLGNHSRFTRHPQESSLYYNQRSKKLLFYDKIKEAKNKKMDIPIQYIGENLLRYELVLKKDVARFLKYNSLLVQDLSTDVLFKKLLHIWYTYYKSIDKISKTIKIMPDNIKTPKDVKEVLYNAFIRSNPIEVNKLMNELKARDVFEHKEYYSRLKSSIRKIQKNEIVENDLMDELNKKIEGIYLKLI